MEDSVDYESAVRQILHLQQARGSTYGLSAVKALAERTGAAQRRVTAIHIAGTNGKGSVGTYLSNILAEAGYRVGRYLSPTLFDYQERFQIVEKISGVLTAEWAQREEIAVGLSLLQEKCDELKKEGIEPSAFERETVLAFLLFEKWGVDVAVVEAGLGGRLDATNIIEEPVLCVFTSIGMDHTQILGDTIEQIAREKYGIIKEGTRVVSAKQAACSALLEKVCREKNASLSYVRQETLTQVSRTVDSTAFSYRGEKYRVPQGGAYQVENATLAVEAVLALQEDGRFIISPAQIKSALQKSYWRGRFDIISRKPFVLCDGAHNIDGIEALCRSLVQCFQEEKFHFIFGVFRDKAYQSMLKRLLPLAKSVRTVKAAGERGMQSEALCSVCKGLFKEGAYSEPIEIKACAGVKEALLQATAQEGKTIVCGSLSLVKEVYAFFNRDII